MTTTPAPDPVQIDLAAILGDPQANPVAETPLAKAVARVSPDDAAAPPAQSHFEFRSMLSADQRSALESRAPELADRLLADRNTLLAFGSKVLDKVNATTATLLAAQRGIELPDANLIVNGILRELDGFSAKFENERVRGLVGRLREAFNSSKNTLKAMYRESKSIEDRLDIAANETRAMELKLADNVSRGQQLYKDNDESLTGLVGVLAALEQVRDAAKERAAALTAELAALPDQDPARAGVEERYATLAESVEALEQTLFDWRQQFFLAYAMSPAVRNLIGVSYAMQRRLQVFRTMGIPGGKKSLAMWQQAALAQQSGEVGHTLAEGTNKLIQGSFTAAGKAVADVAKAAQEPVVTEETIWAIRDSIRAQCDGLVEAGRWGRAVRAKTLAAMETSEREIGQSVTVARETVVREILAEAQAPAEQAPAPDQDVLRALGIE
ncbi:MAG: toxic anion resistance protein [Bifidobacteriaceae bacterium]|jgi:uncharacterized protein YaaN involved in tellurite resistance|nr:toxic anion resistance protein [Bifidobacteriaceae bacterium]